jgi:hypothetical protein
MFVAYAVVAVLFALILFVSAAGKFTKQPPVVENVSVKAGVPLSWFPVLASLQALGAIGLIVGLWVPGIGIAAAAALALYFVGAVVAHLRAGDKGIVPPMVLLLLSVVCLVLRSASA